MHALTHFIIIYYNNITSTKLLPVNIANTQLKYISDKYLDSVLAYTYENQN